MIESFEYNIPAVDCVWLFLARLPLISLFTKDFVEGLLHKHTIEAARKYAAMVGETEEIEQLASQTIEVAVSTEDMTLEEAEEFVRHLNSCHQFREDPFDSDFQLDLFEDDDFEDDDFESD